MLFLIGLTQIPFQSGCRRPFGGLPNRKETAMWPFPLRIRTDDVAQPGWEEKQERVVAHDDDAKSGEAEEGVDV